MDRPACGLVTRVPARPVPAWDHEKETAFGAAIVTSAIRAESSSLVPAHTSAVRFRLDPYGTVLLAVLGVREFDTNGRRWHTPPQYTDRQDH